jgi:hypothetical protein
MRTKVATLALALSGLAGGMAGSGVGVPPASGTTSSDPVVATNRDVDGDGRADTIMLRQLDDFRCRVSVLTATGVQATRVLTNEGSTRCTWHGAGAFDRRRGAELSVLTEVGAHSAWHSLLTWRDDRLVLEPPPGQKTWEVDASVMFDVGITRTVVDGRVRVILRDVARDNDDVFRGTRRVLAYRDGHWVEVRRGKIAVSESTAQALAGWHVRGLTRWA